MMEYTKGPWRLQPANKGDSWAEIYADDPKFGLLDVAQVNITSKHIYGNARLIAAAPDMLQACKQAIEQFPNIELEAKWVKDMAKAIAKAEGREEEKMKAYTLKWKLAHKTGWAQKHGKYWKWHYIAYGTEHTKSTEYPTKRYCELSNTKAEGR